MTQCAQVIEVMRNNGGYATFGQLNTLVDFSTWKTLTPHASIRRIVQQNKKFFKIQPELWALKKYEDIVLNKFQLKTKDKKQEELFTHSYYQGIVVEIGNIKNFDTFIPSQDRNRLFLDKPLKDLTSLNEIHDFSYSEILRYAKTIDVIWFNERKLPHSFFEIEHTTDMKNSLEKFFELQDYFARFFIVASISRKRQFNDIISKSIFNSIKNRVAFVDYENIVNQHSKMFELSQINQLI